MATNERGEQPRRRGLSRETYQKLRHAIVSGELAPDEPLSEAALAERYNVSRTPVREALALLANDGLVRTTPNLGSRVAGISLTDVRELFQMREVLEGLAARLAAQNRNDLEELERLIEEFRPWVTVTEASSVQDYYLLTAKLDATMVQRAGNRRLEDAMHDVWAHSNRIRQFASHDLDRLRASAAEHIAILESVRDGDPDLAEKRLRDHLANSRTALITKVMGLQ